MHLWALQWTLTEAVYPSCQLAICFVFSLALILEYACFCLANWFFKEISVLKFYWSWHCVAPSLSSSCCWLAFISILYMSQKLRLVLSHMLFSKLVPCILSWWSALSTRGRVSHKFIFAGGVWFRFCWDLACLFWGVEGECCWNCWVLLLRLLLGNWYGFLIHFGESDFFCLDCVEPSFFASPCLWGSRLFIFLSFYFF
jgi:hypothetical protein